MKHRIIVLGAGYAGAASAGYLARHLHPDDVEITVVNAEADFVERMRMHQLAAGHKLKRFGLAKMFAGTGIRLKVARVTEVDAARRTVAVDGGEELGYDTLLYTLGSTAANSGVPGAQDHAFHVAERPAAQRLRERLDDLTGNEKVLVVGGNLTGIEVATEIAEARPDLWVSLATQGELGGWLGGKARTHLLAAFDRLGIGIHEHSPVERVEEGKAFITGGAVLDADVIVWTAGFEAHPIAQASGLEVEDNGRIRVDATMRSVSHPEVFAAGDSVRAIGDNGAPLPMSCATAGFTRMRATAAIIGDLTGGRAAKLPLAYFGNCVSLGSRDALFQMVDGQARSKTWAVRGRPATWLKNFVLRTVAWSMDKPTYGLPTRRRRLAATDVRTGKVVAD
jgi:NADH:ubiquinone reductase (H+-translocating)